jgi:hypothetical protein
LKLPKRRFREHRNPPKSLNDAMTEVACEDLARSGCILCRGPADITAAWFPTAEVIANDLGGDPTKARGLAYRLCSRCLEIHGPSGRLSGMVEQAILAVHKAGGAIRIQGGSCGTNP